MKIKNIFQLLGLRGKPKHYGYNIQTFTLRDDVKVRYAQWLHPKESTKILTQEMVDAYQKIVSDGDFCIDIGAHTGDSVLPMALAVGRSGCVLALEPNPFIYHVLEKNARMNSERTHIKTLMAAAATTPGFVSFEYSDAGFCNGGRHEGISFLEHGHAFNLDVFCVDLESELQEDYACFLPRLTFIKVDAEGYDLYVLKSISNLIKKYRPIIKAEIFKSTDDAYRREMLAFFQDLNYAVFKIEQEPLTVGAQITEHNLHAWKHYDVLCQPLRSD